MKKSNFYPASRIPVRLSGNRNDLAYSSASHRGSLWLLRLHKDHNAPFDTRTMEPERNTR